MADLEICWHFATRVGPSLDVNEPEAETNITFMLLVMTLGLNCLMKLRITRQMDV